LLNRRCSVQDPCGPCLPRPVRGEIAFEGVRFRYPARPEAGAGRHVI
jgi:ATP-binding cassette, subfamily B, bacterial